MHAFALFEPNDLSEENEFEVEALIRRRVLLLFLDPLDLLGTQKSIGQGTLKSMSKLSSLAMFSL